MPDRAARLGRRYLTYAVFLLFVLAAGWVLYSRRHQLGAAMRELSWFSILGSAVFGLLAVLSMLMSWEAALRDGGVRLPLRDTTRIYAIGQVGKYIPGSVWPVLAQAQLARRRGVSPLRVGAASLLALAVSVCTIMFVGGVLLPFSDATAARRLWWTPLVALAALGALHPAILNRLLGFAARVLRRGDVGFDHTTRGVLVCAAWCLPASVFFGAHIYLLARAFGAHGPRDFALCVCAYALASAIGVAIIFLPAGSGAREAVLTLVLAPALKADAALVVALVSRAILVVVDVTFGLSQVHGIRHWAADGEQPVRPEGEH